MKRVLSIDGGGMLGRIPAAILSSLYGKNQTASWDLLAGTSTGGIIAIGLGLGLSPARIVQFYDECGQEIFHRVAPNWNPFRSRYEADGRLIALTQHFGLRSFAQCSPRTMIPAYNMRRQRPKVFKSWSTQDDLLTAVDVAMATSAAPIYFPPEEPGYCDGGLCLNHPAMVAYTEAKRLWGNHEQLFILSLGCGHSPDKGIAVNRRDDHGWGALRWLRNGLVPDIMMHAPLEAVDYQMKVLTEIYGDVYVRIDPEIPASLNVMDRATPEQMSALGDISAKWLKENASIASRLRTMLRSANAPWFGPSSLAEESGNA